MPKIVIGLGGLGSTKSIKETIVKQAGVENNKNFDFIIINSDEERVFYRERYKKVFG